MAKQRSKRIALTVPADLDEVLTKLSAATNQPKTSIILELLSDTAPALNQVLVAIEQAKQGQQELALKTMAEFMGKATLDLNQAHLDIGEMRGALHGKR